MSTKKRIPKPMGDIERARDPDAEIEMHTKLRRRKTLEQMQALRQAKRMQNILEGKYSKIERKRQAAKVKVPFVRAEHLVLANRRRRQDSTRTRRVSRRLRGGAETAVVAPGQDESGVSTDVVFVVRVQQAKRKMTARSRKMLHKVGLNVVHTGVFMRWNDDTKAFVRAVDPFIVFGHPSLATVSRLVLTKARIRDTSEVQGKKKASIQKDHKLLTDNTVVVKHLGHLGVICLEDIVDVLYRGGEHMDLIVRFLAPFKLVSPPKSFKKLSCSTLHCPLPGTSKRKIAAVRAGRRPGHVRDAKKDKITENRRVRDQQTSKWANINYIVHQMS